MNSAYKNLGKVRPTPEGSWSRNKEYSVLSIVNDEFTDVTYISVDNVPEGIDINNKNYWQKITSAGYRDNNIIILSDVDENGNLIKYTLQEAINSININDRRPGLILGFYGNNNNGSIEITETWFLFQYNYKDNSNWDNLNYWDSIYSNVNKFKGYFINKCKLVESYPLPSTGDYAYVGEVLKLAIVYKCITNGEWTETDEKITDFVKIILDGNITIGPNGNWFQDGVDTGFSAECGSGGSINVDNVLSEVSRNPVENRVINKALKNKQNVLKDGENIKTINGESILGSGNIEIKGGGSGTSDYKKLNNKPQINNVELDGNKTLEELNIQKKGDYALKSDLDTLATKDELKEKQDTLVSGVNIATINNQDITKGGNINIEGGGGGETYNPNRPATETTLGYSLLKTKDTTKDFDYIELTSTLEDKVYYKTISRAGDGIGTVSPLTRVSGDDAWGWKSAIIICGEGDKFFIKGRDNAGLTKLFCFVDTSNVILDFSGEFTTSSGLFITAPKNTTKLIFNSYASMSETEIYKLRKNNKDKFLLTQNMLNKPFTIYEIQDDFSGDGTNIIMPKNSVLKFNGGFIRNCNIKGENTSIEAVPTKIFERVGLEGSYYLHLIYPEWFGADSIIYKSIRGYQYDTGHDESAQPSQLNIPDEIMELSDSSDAFNLALTLSSLSGGEVELQSRMYRINKTVNFPMRAVMHTQNDTVIVPIMEGDGKTKIIHLTKDTPATDNDGIPIVDEKGIQVIWPLGKFVYRKSETPYDVIIANELFADEAMAKAFTMSPIRTKFYGGGSISLIKSKYTIGIKICSDGWNFTDCTYNSPVVDMCIFGEPKSRICHDPKDDFNLEGKGRPIKETLPPDSTNEKYKGNFIYYLDIDPESPTHRVYFHRGCDNRGNWGDWQPTGYSDRAQWNTCVRFDVRAGWYSGRIFNPRMTLNCMFGARGIEVFVNENSNDIFFNESVITGFLGEFYSNYMSIYCGNYPSNCSEHDWSKLHVQSGRYNSMANSSLFYAVKAGGFTLGHMWDVSQLGCKQYYSYYLGKYTIAINIPWTDGIVKDLGVKNKYGGQETIENLDYLKQNNILKYRTPFDVKLTTANFNHYVEFKTPVINSISYISDKLGIGKNENYNKMPFVYFNEQYGTQKKDIINTDGGAYGMAFDMVGATVGTPYSKKRGKMYLCIEYTVNKWVDTEAVILGFTEGNTWLKRSNMIPSRISTKYGKDLPMQKTIFEISPQGYESGFFTIFCTEEIPGFVLSLYNIKCFTETPLPDKEGIYEGSTKNRPTAPPEGHIYFDTDLSKYIKWENGKWGDLMSNILPTIRQTSTTVTLEPSTYNIWETPQAGSITIENTDFLNPSVEYIIQITAEGDSCSLILSSNVKWANEKVPVFKGGKTYLISISNNLALFSEF